MQQVEMVSDQTGIFRERGSHFPKKVGAKQNEAGEWITNPFWEGFELTTKKKRTTLQTDEEQVLVGVKTGIATNATEITKVYEVDDEKFLKVFSRFLHVFFDIRKSTQKLFEVVLYEIGKKANQDLVYLHPIQASNYHERRGSKYSQASFYRSINEMKEVGFIVKSAEGPNLYFVNPAIFWNGDRIKFITEIYKSPQITSPSDRGSENE